MGVVASAGHVLWVTTASRDAQGFTGAWNVAGRVTRTSIHRVAVILACRMTLGGFIGGCGGDARVELAAADSMETLGASMAQTLSEYHADLARVDDERQRAAIQAFIDRVRADVSDEAATDTHADAFQKALERLDTDRRAAWERYTASSDNVATLHEIAQDLRRLALNSMSLDDEVRRYFGDVMKRRKETKEQVSGKGITNGQQR